MTDSYRFQKAAQEAEELDLRNGGYEERFILGMRTVKGKIIHLRVVAACLIVLLLILAPMPASIVLVVVVLIFALRIRIYPLHTRIENGNHSPLSGPALYQEQHLYLWDGPKAAIAYLIFAGALMWAVFTIYGGRLTQERAKWPVIGDLNWQTANQTEFGQKLELALMFLFCIAVGLIIASCLRWFNIISCGIQLKKHQAHEAPSCDHNPVASRLEVLSTIKRKGSDLSTWIAVLALGLPCGGLMYGYLSRTRFTSNSIQASQPNPVPVPQPNSVQVYPPAGACPILQMLQVAIGDERGYSQSDRYFCIDQTQHLSLLMHDGKLIPITAEAWSHGWPGSAFVLITDNGQKLNSSEWNSFIAAHPTDQRVTVLSSLCKLRIPVLTDEGDENEDTIAGPEGSYQVLRFGNACASLVQPTDILDVARSCMLSVSGEPLADTNSTSVNLSGSGFPYRFPYRVSYRQCDDGSTSLPRKLLLVESQESAGSFSCALEIHLEGTVSVHAENGVGIISTEKGVDGPKYLLQLNGENPVITEYGGGPQLPFSACAWEPTRKPSNNK